MALISCPDCNKQVSESAPTCPQCGAPIAGASEAKGAGTVLTTTQDTSKRLKVHIIFSSIFFWVGLIWSFIAVGADKSYQLMAGWLSIFGLGWYIVTRFRIWWHHK